MVQELIAFLFSALVMIWAFRSAAFAFSGTARSGLHEVVKRRQEEIMLTSEQLAFLYQRDNAAQQRLVYAASVVVSGSLGALLIAASLA
tara:strand:- start:1955 stop:2221 length:267 start_codon:yes stop_codon:yes gene_type:complete